MKRRLTRGFPTLIFLIASAGIVLGSRQERPLPAEGAPSQGLDQPTVMVEMQMGEDDAGDVLRLDAHPLQSPDEVESVVGEAVNPPVLRGKVAADPRLNKDRLAVAAQEKAVQAEPDAILLVRPRVATP